MSTPRRTARLSIAASIPFSIALACASQSPLEWSDVRALDAAPGSGAMLVFQRESDPPAPALIDGAVSTVAPGGPICAGSIRFDADGQGTLYAAWWSPRDDSSAVLLVARSASKAWDAWDPPVVADARDSSSLGCGRPAPAIAADGATGYVHLAYFLDSPTDGRGVYGGHSMDRGAYFHGPVPVVFGDRPVRVAVANDGERVAIAYEDPNSERARVALAVSLTAGHIYEHRSEASPPSMRATAPAVALDGRRIAVAWDAEEWEKGAQGSRPVVRVAVLTDSTRRVWTEEGE